MENNMKSIVDILLKSNITPGTALYTPITGDVHFLSIFPSVEKNEDGTYKRTIAVTTSNGSTIYFDEYGRFNKDGECLLFPCNAVREWNDLHYVTFTAFKPFDKVLVRNGESKPWRPSIYQFYDSDFLDRPHLCGERHWSDCIPYNENTAPLVGKVLPVPTEQEN